MVRRSVFLIFGIVFIPLASADLLSGLKQAIVGTASPSLDTDALTKEEKPQVPVVDDTMYAQSLEEMDLMCVNGTHAQAWFNIQQKMRYILGPDAAFNPLDRANTLEPALYSVMEDMSAASAETQDVCGVGKLLVQMLSILAVDTDGTVVKQQIRENERMTSPILTLLLDVPWSAFQPMWPVFGFFAQIAMRRVQNTQNAVEIDGLQLPELQQYAAALNMAIINGDLEALRSLSKAYLDSGLEGIETSPLGFLTAIFTQAAVAEKQEDAQALFFEAQRVMKKMVFNPEDLDTTMGTRWPLWGMAYLASLKTVG